MPIGTAVRQRLGRYEVPAVDLFRSAFVDLDSCAEILASMGDATRILEIGAGDGRLATHIVAAFPHAQYLGLDVVDGVGRLYEGPAERASFRNQRAEALLAENPDPFDLVLVVDVLHHVPIGERGQLLQVAGALTGPRGRLVIKEWERRPGLGYRIGHFADRVVSGDKTVRFHDRDELLHQVTDAFGPDVVSLVARVPPWRSNILVAVTPPERATA